MEKLTELVTVIIIIIAVGITIGLYTAMWNIVKDAADRAKKGKTAKVVGIILSVFFPYGLGLLLVLTYFRRLEVGHANSNDSRRNC